MNRLLKLSAFLFLALPTWSNTVRVYQGSTRGQGLGVTHTANPVKFLDNCIVYVCTTDVGYLNQSGDTDYLVYALTHPQWGKIYFTYEEVNSLEYAFYGVKNEKSLGAFRSALPEMFSSFTGTAKNGILESFKITPSSMSLVNANSATHSTLTGSFRLNAGFIGHADPASAAAAVEAHLRSKGYRAAP